MFKRPPVHHTLAIIMKMFQGLDCRAKHVQMPWWRCSAIFIKVSQDSFISDTSRNQLWHCGYTQSTNKGKKTADGFNVQQCYGNWFLISQSSRRTSKIKKNKNKNCQQKKELEGLMISILISNPIFVSYADFLNLSYLRGFLSLLKSSITALKAPIYVFCGFCSYNCLQKNPTIKINILSFIHFTYLPNIQSNQHCPNSNNTVWNQGFYITNNKRVWPLMPRSRPPELANTSSESVIFQHFNHWSQVSIIVIQKNLMLSHHPSWMQLWRNKKPISHSRGRSLNWFLNNFSKMRPSEAMLVHGSPVQNIAKWHSHVKYQKLW